MNEKRLGHFRDLEYNKKRIALRLKNARFVIPDGTSFHDLYKNKSADNIGELINLALHAIEDANGDRLEGLFSIDFNSDVVLGKTDQRNKMLRHLMDDFAKIDLTAADDDVIGNAYMYMIERFGADAGKKAGEFFTVRSVATLLTKLAKPQPGGSNEERKDVFFVEASKFFRSAKAQNVMDDEHIQTILGAVEERRDQEKFCRVVQPDEIAENDYNLNITRYVDTFEEEEEVDIEANLKEMAEIDAELADLEKEMDGHLKALGILK